MFSFIRKESYSWNLVIVLHFIEAYCSLQVLFEFLIVLIFLHHYMTVMFLYAQSSNIYLYFTSRVPAVLLRGNPANAYISYQFFLPESLS
jgi:hypothetical protein